MAPASGVAEGCQGRLTEGSIRGSNLHETRDNSEQLKPHGNAEKQVHGPPDTSGASRWGREGRWFESSRPDYAEAAW
jgi:hypothetical protein